jgi:hypothetical protein
MLWRLEHTRANMNKILTPCMLAWATLCGAWGAATNETSYWPHYGRGGMIFDKNTNYVWGYHEVPHRVRWHDGFYGEELVRLELATNVTRTPWASDVPYAWVDTNRVLRVIHSGKTNEVHLKCLGFGMVTNEVQVEDPWVTWSNKWTGMIDKLNQLNSNMDRTIKILSR